MERGGVLEVGQNRETRDRYRVMLAQKLAVLDHLPDAVFVTDATSRVVFMNRAAEALCRLPAERVVGRPLEKFEGGPTGFPPFERVRDQVRQVGSWREDIHLDLKEGATVWVEGFASACELEGGETGYLVRMRDITKERETQTALCKSESKFRSIAEQSSDLIALTDAEGIITYASHATLDMFQVTAEEMQGRHFFEFLDPASIPRAAETFQRATESGSRVKNLELTMKRRDGSSIFGELNGSHLRIGEETFALVLIRDITERRRAEEARERSLAELRRRKMELESLLEGSRAVLEGGDFASKARRIFDAAREMTGARSGYVALLSPSGEENEVLFLEAGGLPCAVDPTLPMPIRGLRGEAYRTGRAVFENDFMGSRWVAFIPEGHVDLRNVLFAPLAIEGRVVGILGLANKPGDFDDDDLRMAEAFGQLAAIALRNSQSLEALRRSEKNLAEAQRQTHMGSFEFDFRTRRLHWSEEMFSIFGIRHEDFRGVQEDFTERVHPEDLPRVARSREEGRARPGPLELDFRVVRPGGEVRSVRMIFETFFDDREAPLRRIGTFQDLTELRKAEEERARLEVQLQQAMKMEAVGRLAGGVAHDFNNLLTTISGNVELALLDLVPNDPLTETLGDIGSAAESAAALTRQLLAFSRRQLIEPRVLDLNERIAKMQRMLVRLIGEDIELLTHLGEELGAVRIDPGQLEQILVNMVVNARDAMPEGGELILETAGVELDEEYCRRHADARPGRYVRLSVSDVGHGMSEETKVHLFEPFFTTKGKGKGTGLGLATIYGAVKQAGGSIEVYSEVGLGTTFKVYLPRVDEEKERLAEDARAVELQKGNETILLVEDEVMVRDLAIRILKRLGYSVLPAGSGQEALAVAETHAAPIHLLLTDVVMPGMNGRQLAERIAKAHPEVKVLYTSGYTENAIAHHGVIDAGLSFIGKPYAPQTLAKKLREVLEGR
jgi:PAS domain S-box-containing protein